MCNTVLSICSCKSWVMRWAGSRRLKCTLNGAHWQNYSFISSLSIQLVIPCKLFQVFNYWMEIQHKQYKQMVFLKLKLKGIHLYVCKTHSFLHILKTKPIFTIFVLSECNTFQLTLIVDCKNNLKTQPCDPAVRPASRLRLSECKSKSKSRLIEQLTIASSYYGSNCVFLHLETRQQQDIHVQSNAYLTEQLLCYSNY